LKRPFLVLALHGGWLWVYNDKLRISELAAHPQHEVGFIHTVIQDKHAASLSARTDTIQVGSLMDKPKVEFPVFMTHQGLFTLVNALQKPTARPITGLTDRPSLHRLLLETRMQCFGGEAWRKETIRETKK
jgi:hypothetical protein